MKKLIFCLTVLVAGFTYNGNAQVSFQLNISSQPLWGPEGYDYVEYYYLPDIDAYYDVSAQQYVYYNYGGWRRYSYLPSRYRNFDLYRAHKVVINNPNPWLNHNKYRNNYMRYRGVHDQVVIRDSRDQRYWANPSHPHHGHWRSMEKSRDWGGWRDNKQHHNDQHDNSRRRGWDKK